MVHQSRQCGEIKKLGSSVIFGLETDQKSIYFRHKNLIIQKNVMNWIDNLRKTSVSQGVIATTVSEWMPG